MCYYSINESTRGIKVMSEDENQFWDLISEETSTLYVDNDMCYIEDSDNEESQSFGFTPERLVFLFAEKLGIAAEQV
tara:strand:- start:560 stop:790 length:231 start_codon:yes stop_codon:yes gene_type:complete